MTLTGYAVRDPLARSKHTLLYRGERDGRSVLLEQLEGQYPPLAASRALEFEYRILSKLRVPGVVEARGLEYETGRPVLVLADFGGDPLELAPGERLPIEQFFDVAIRAVEALANVHARGVIHKHIEPRHLLWNSRSGELRLRGFQRATELSREEQSLEIWQHLDVALPYLSPEQTGRMNRALDYRTDYYSLGVTLFRLLTGHLPLEASDAMGWIHAHISRPPSDAAALYGAPPGLSLVLAKLLAKDPDARYQGARGLSHDLEHCRSTFGARRAVPAFTVGEHDVSERFLVSQRLVGREPELRALTAVFEEVREGNARLLLVSGHSGVGKSSLIRELLQPITRAHGRFVSGKFDQIERSVPYEALVQALRDLVRQLLAAPEEALQATGARVRAALGPNGRVMVDLVPELQGIIGETEPAPALNPTEAQHRFKRVVADFIGVFARPDHPLVIFLDDLQWADASSPDLIAELVLAEAAGHLLIICAYRDNEVQDGHLLPIAVKKVQRHAPNAVSALHLEPLSLAGVTQLCSDALRRPAAESRALAELVFEKTSGNPFFATELLNELRRSGAIELAPGRGGWDYDLTRARRASVTDNVVEWMLGKLAALPPDARRALCTAACLGNQFELATLASLLERSTSETARVLWEPIERGLLVPSDDQYRLAEGSSSREEQPGELRIRYRFQHDRLQRAAYSMLGRSEQTAAHLAIGRALAADLGRGNDERLFEVTNHLNLARARISDPRERAELAALNARAASRAKSSTAYGIAADYLDVAVELGGLAEQDAPPAERFALFAERVECVLQAGDSTRAAALCGELEGLAPSRLARAKVYLLEARILEAQARFVESVGVVRAALATFGVTLPADPDAIGQSIGVGIGRMQGHLAERSPEELLALPDLADPDQLMVVNLLFQVIPAAIQTFPPLFVLAELIMFDVALTHGLAAAHAKNFVDCGIIQGGILGDYATAYRLGRVAFQILERFGARAIASGVNFVFATYVSSWRAPHDEALRAFQESYRAGSETGDLQHMGFATALRMHRLLHIGHDLADCRAELGSALAFLERSNLPSQRTAVILVERALGRLCDGGASAEQQARADELATVAVLASQNPQWIYAYAESQLIVSLFLNDAAAALRWQAMAAPHVPSAIGLVSVPEYHLARAVLLTRHEWPDASPERRAELTAEVQAIAEQLRVWAESCPENFAHKHHLVKAELARIEGQPLHEVLQHYEQAAQTTGPVYIQMRALALELHARYWKERGESRFAQALLRDARDLYARWGAAVKVAELDREVTGAERPERSSLGSALDLASVLKASQAISSEVQNERLFESLMSTLLENAAAERGCLILCDERSGAPSVEAEASVAGPIRVESQPLPAAAGVCFDIVQYALRSREPLVLDDARAHPHFSANAYVVEHGLRSVLCLPIMHQGKPIAAFYAENNLTTGAFPPQRMAPLQLIAGQAAISIVNARLYANLEARVAARTEELASTNREVLAMLDGMDQALFSLDSDLRIGPRYSRQLVALLGTGDIAGRSVGEVLLAHTDLGSDRRAALEMALRCSFGGTPVFASLNSDHLAREFTFTGVDGQKKQCEVSWNLVTNAEGTIDKILVVLRDVTLLRELRAAQDRAAFEMEVVAEILSAGIDPFQAFCRSASEVLIGWAQLRSAARRLGPSDALQLFRELHTLKGHARGLGFRRIVDQLHATEALLEVHGGVGEPHWDAVARALTELQASLDAHAEIAQRKLAGLWTSDRERLARAVEAIDAALEGPRSRPSQLAPALQQIEHALREVRSVPLETLLADARRGVASLAAELGKPPPSIEWGAAGTTLAPAWARVLRDVFTHTFRNAVDHGIEAPEERVARGKRARGLIRLSTEPRADGLRIRLTDDGRGLALARLRERAAAAPGSDEALAEMIFHPGVTTAQQVSTISGRGVGMDAVRSAIHERGGRVALSFTGNEEFGYRPFELVIDLPAGATV